MADNSDLASMLGDGTKSFLEYLRRSGRNLADGGGAAVDWLASGARSGAEPTLAMMQPGAADQPFLPTADSGGRIGTLASALTGPMTPMTVPKGGMVLGAGPTFKITNRPNGTAHILAEMPEGHVGGEIQNGTLRINHADIPDPANRGKGHGVGMYESLLDYARQNNLGVTSDMTVEAPAVRIYEALKRRGYDVERNPGGGIFEDDGTHWNTSPVFTVNPHKPTAPVAFDPAKAGSSDLLASRAPTPHAPQTEEQKRAAIAELLRNGGT